jgi:hypothetical protein
MVRHLVVGRNVGDSRRACDDSGSIISMSHQSADGWTCELLVKVLAARGIHYQVAGPSRYRLDDGMTLATTSWRSWSRRGPHSAHLSLSLGLVQSPNAPGLTTHCGAPPCKIASPEAPRIVVARFRRSVILRSSSVFNSVHSSALHCGPVSSACIRLSSLTSDSMNKCSYNLRAASHQQGPNNNQSIVS